MSPSEASQLVVDVIVTNHNYGRFLEAAIGSACEQTHPRVNVIAVDDGSTDESRAVLGQFEDRVEVVLKERGGQASALNAGFARCRGDVVLLLDADDVLRPEAAARVAAAFAADPDLVKVQFRMAVIDGDGRPTGATKPSGHLHPPTGDVRSAELSFPFDLAWLPGGGTAFRTAAIRRLVPIPEADYPRCGADWYLVHLAALLGPAAALEEVCAEYRIHGSNGYELDRPHLDLDHIRDAIVYAAATCRALERQADALSLGHPAPILSLSDLANRMISIKLEPWRHPVVDDRVLGLLGASLRAVRRRFDVSLPMKGMFFAWFLAAAVAPRPLARRLGVLFLFPDRRRSFNRLLGRLQRSDGGARMARLD